MDYFTALRVFVRSVELGSFSKAALEEGAKVSTVSRYVGALEADLGVALFNRSTRRLHLTEAGKTFYDHGLQVLASLDEAKAATSALNVVPRGLLRINIPATFGRLHVVPHIDKFLAAYPEINIDATLTDATVDLIEAGADVAVRIGALADSSLIARRLARHHRILVASPAYVQARAAPLRPEDLSEHACLPFALLTTNAWYFRREGVPSTEEPIPVKVSGRFRANDAEALHNAALSGLGIGLLPSWLVGGDIPAGRLIRLLPEWEGLIAVGPERAIWGIYPPKRAVSPKVRAFLDFLHTRFGEPAYWDRPADEPAARNP
jgi:DNA-binding transcriptional LysR family regulator